MVTQNITTIIWDIMLTTALLAISIGFGAPHQVADLQVLPAAEISTSTVFNGIGPAPVIKTETTVSSPFFKTAGTFEIAPYSKVITSIYVSRTYSGSTAPQTVLQQKINGDWKDVLTVGKNSAVYSSHHIEVRPSGMTGSAGITGKHGTRQTYRLAIHPTDEHNGSFSPERVISWAAPKAQSISQLPFGKSSKVTSSQGNHVRNLKLEVPYNAGTARLETKIGGKWVTGNPLYKSYNAGKTYVDVWSYVNPGTTNYFRMSLAQTDTHAAWTSQTQTVVRTKDPTNLSVYNFNNLSVASNLQKEFTGWIPQRKREVQLQRWNGKKWVVAQKVSTNSNGQFTVKTPKNTASQTVKYRVSVPATSVNLGSDSKTVNIKHVNPRHYTGYKKDIYRHIKKWCPNIVIDTSNPKGKKYAGLAFMGANRIEVVTGLNASNLKRVSLHECAHTVQARVYKNNWNELYGKMNKVYGQKNSLGVEFNADCMTKAMGYTGRLSYNNNCSGNRMKVAQLHLKGKRF